MNKTSSPTMGVDEAAAVLGVSRDAVYDAVNRGEIQAVKVGRAVRIARRPLELALGLNPQESK